MKWSKIRWKICTIQVTCIWCEINNWKDTHLLDLLKTILVKVSGWLNGRCRLKIIKFPQNWQIDFFNFSLYGAFSNLLSSRCVLLGKEKMERSNKTTSNVKKWLKTSKKWKNLWLWSYRVVKVTKHVPVEALNLSMDSFIHAWQFL